MIVGIDIGGTKTHVVVEDAGRTLLDTVVPSAQWQHGGLLDDDENISRLVSVFQNIDGAGEAALVAGVHGLDSDWQTLEFNRLLALRHNGPVRAVNDVELLGAAAELEDAIAVIVGTGSKVVGRTSDGSVISAGGYGYLLSDPGSAPGLAREAVRAVLDARDTGAAPDALGRGLMRHFGVDDEVALSYAFTTNPHLTTWGAMCPLVFDAADEGSARAASVIDAAATELALGVSRLHARGAIGTDVVCAGGVITNQPRLYRALTRHIEDLQLELTVHLLTVAPVVGALALAKSMHVHASSD